MICSWDLWWKTNVTPACQLCFRAMSSTFFFVVQWCHWDKFELQSEPSGGGFTSIPFTHRLHFSLKQIFPLKTKKLLIINHKSNRSNRYSTKIIQVTWKIVSSYFRPKTYTKYHQIAKKRNFIWKVSAFFQSVRTVHNFPIDLE